MRILFAAPGLETGRDGVGDYCRRLAGQLSLLSHSVALLALNDSLTNGEVDWIVGDGGYCTARLPANLSAEERWQRARFLIEKFDPDWISLHFVCYGFHPRGVVGGLAGDFAKLFAGRRLHLMMHELWVMWGMKCRLADRLMGLFQRRGVLRVLRSLRPDLMDTTIPFYQAVLNREGFECGLLPLCGNFTPVHGDARDWFEPELTKAGMLGLWPREKPLLVAGFFGTIFGHWDPAPLLGKLSEAARAAGQEILLLSGGKCSAAGERLFDKLPESVDGVALHKLRLGVLSTEQASQYLNTLDLGLTCYSKLFVGKSSTAATMLDHGLSVLAGGDDCRLEKIWVLNQQVRGIIGLNEIMPMDAKHGNRLPPKDSSTEIAEEFLLRLKAAT